MTIHIERWAHRDSDPDGAANHAASQLRVAPWFASVGAASDLDAAVVRVATWHDAFRMFRDGVSREFWPRTGTATTGTLNAPNVLLTERIDREAALFESVTRKADAAVAALPRRHYAAAKDVGALVPRDAWPQRAGFDESGPGISGMVTLGDYAHEYLKLLFREIYAGDLTEPRCTYFRDQLGWFCAGLLPCGWDGDWPDGRMRVL